MCFIFFSVYTLTVSLCESSCHSSFVRLFDIEITKCTHTCMQWLVAASFFCQSAPTLGSGDWQWCVCVYMCVYVCVSVSWSTAVRLNLDDELRPPAPLGLTDRQITVGLWSRSARLSRAATERASCHLLMLPQKNLINTPAGSVVGARSRWPSANPCRRIHDPHVTHLCVSLSNCLSSLQADWNSHCDTVNSVKLKGIRQGRGLLWGTKLELMMLLFLNWFWWGHWSLCTVKLSYITDCSVARGCYMYNTKRFPCINVFELPMWQWIATKFT